MRPATNVCMANNLERKENELLFVHEGCLLWISKPNVESEPSVASDDSYTPSKRRTIGRSTYRSLMKEARRIAQTTKKSDLKNGSDVQWLRCGSFESWEEVEALRRHKRVVIKDTTFMSRGVSKGATKTNYRCTTWNTIKCPYKMYSVIKEGDTTYEMFEANEHSPLCEKILAVKLPLDVRKYKRDYKQQRQSWNYPAVQKAMEQFVNDEKKFKDLDELVSELATIFDKQSCTLNLKYYLTHYSDSSKILEQLIPDWLISQGWFAWYSERRSINRQIKVKEASQRLLKSTQEKLCREERLRIFKESNTIREPQFSQLDATALGQIQLDNDSKRITRNFPRIEHDYHLLSYCKPVTEFKTKNEAMRYCYKRPLLRVNTGNSERAVKYRCHVRGCEHAVYCVQAENGNFVVWSNEEHNHDDDKFFVSLVDERDVKKAYAGSGRRLYQFNPTDAEVAVNNANNSYSETASCSTAVQNKSNSDNFGYVTNDMKRSSNRYANGFMKFNSRVDAHIYLTSRGMRQSAYVPEWGSNGSKYRLTYKCSEKDCPFIMTGSLYYDKSWGYATQIQLWMHHHHSHPEFMKDWQRKLPESSSPPNDQVRPAKLRRIE
ncbi:hypothetical protein Ddc_16277 [Ditylenchus destructor]|nr:hypothetical protein Ddc_16277 [Ditylenchus destructor]